MKSRIGKWLVVMGLVFVTGSHWMILQSAAWLGMFVRFSQRDSVVVALEKTFDGQHPCKLCKAVEEGKKSEKKQEVQQLQTKLDFLLSRNTFVLFPPSPLSALSGATELGPLRTESPPKPPPRLV